MKKIKSVLVLILLIASISSCKNSSVVSKFGIQKRKFTKGWSVSKSNKFKDKTAKPKKNFSRFSEYHKPAKTIVKKDKAKPLSKPQLFENSLIEKEKTPLPKLEKKPLNLVINKANKESKIKTFEQKKTTYLDDPQTILLKIGFVIGGVIIILAFLGLLLYIGTLSTLLAWIMGILLSIISLVFVTVAYIVLTFFIGYYGMGSDELILVIITIVGIIISLLVSFYINTVLFGLGFSTGLAITLTTLSIIGLAVAMGLLLAFSFF